MKDPQYVSRPEFNDFKEQVLGAIRGLTESVGKMGDKLSDRIDSERLHHDEQVRELQKKQADAGKPNWGVLVGLTSVVWAIVAAGLAWGMSQSIKAENTSVQTQTYQQQTSRWIDATQKWVTDNDARDDAQDVHIGSLGAADTNTLLRMEALGERATRLEEWYNGHGQNMVADIARVEGQTAEFQATLFEHIDDLDDIRKQLHAHVGDGHPRRVESLVSAVDERTDRLESQYDELLKLVMQVRESRNTKVDGNRRDELLRELSERISAMEAKQQ